MDSLDEFEGKKLQREKDADIPATESDEPKDSEDDIAPLVARTRYVLGERVGELRTTHRLT